MKENTYETREMWLAAALELAGHFVTDIRFERESATFVITVPQNFDAPGWEAGYWNNKLEMPVLALKEKVKEIRTRMNKLKELN